MILEKSAESIKTLTPKARLVKRINREFTRKKMIGDITINDEEFDVLMEILREDYSLIVNYTPHIINSPSLCVALVQIGIRYYDGAFWPYVKREIGNPFFASNHQTWLGDSFFRTIKKYNKLYVSVGEHVDNILMHAFVSDVFSDKFFNFLYAFYKIDLDRDISRLDRSTMNELIETIKREDNSGRTYLLVEHTADSVRKNTRGAKTRIRRYINLIDKAFWGDEIPENPSNRLMNRFLYWCDNSAEFSSDRVMSAKGKRGGRKSFMAPILHYDAKRCEFKILLPKQIIRFENAYDIWWKIEATHFYKRIEIEVYNQGVTGNQTDEIWMEIDSSILFEGFTFSLMNGEERIKFFKIPSEDIRFFDADGYFQKNDCIQEGAYTSFSKKGFIPISEAILYKASQMGLMCVDYDFVKGDLICLPDGKSISVGGRIQEGIGLRGIIEGIRGLVNDSLIPTYRSLPSILVKLPPSKLNGTAILINDKKIHMCLDGKIDKRISEIELNDRSGEKGYVINLKDWVPDFDGIVRIAVDAPNERSYRDWTFAYIKDFSFEFEDAPYIFVSRGTLSIPLKYEFRCNSHICNQEVSDKRRFNFDIKADNLTVLLNYKNIDFRFEVPALSYCFKGEDWMIESHTDVWHADFKPMLFLRFNADRLRVFLNDVGDDDSEIHQAFFTKIKSRGLFECDLNVFKSWFGREQVSREIRLELPGMENSVKLLKVVTKSVVVGGTLTGDYERNIIKGDFDIIGRADYYADLMYEKETIAKSIPIVDGKFEINSRIKSGLYKVILFEANLDDSGFGDIELSLVDEMTTKLVNPKDLTGSSVEIYGIKPLFEQSVFLQLDYKYKIINLKPTAESNCVYSGKMVVELKTFIQATFPVLIEFDINNIKSAYISYVDEDNGDNLEFLYDEAKRSIVKSEDKSLSKSQAYRRYRRSLYQDEYSFDVGFFVADKRYLEANVQEDSYNNLRERQTFSVFKEASKKILRIDNMNFSSRTFNCLSRAGIFTADDIAKLSKSDLYRVRSLGNEGAEEVIARMQSLGYDFPSK